MLALALAPLLDNMRLLGMGKALRILQAIATMSRESAEGQAIELFWVREGTFDQRDEDYERMVEKKTSFYSFVTPAMIGAIIAEADASRIAELTRFAKLLGIAFQIQDDVLNVAADETRYGKEIGGDLWEGKHTLILLHALRCATMSERDRACAILRKSRPRPSASHMVTELGQVERAIDDLSGSGELSDAAITVLSTALESVRLRLTTGEKTRDDVAFLMDVIQRYHSVEYARQVALRRARDAARVLSESCSWLRASVHRSFLEGLVEYVIHRDR
jgi:geranylgeranyl diphosphate synthase type II